MVSCHAADSKPVKQEVNGTGIIPPLVFPEENIYLPCLLPLVHPMQKNNHSMHNTLLFKSHISEQNKVEYSPMQVFSN
jgi:hypothetical protein